MDKSNALDKYQEAAARTANHDYPAIIKRLQDNPQLLELNNYAMGLAGEAGEIVDLVKKIVFHGHPLGDEELKNLLKEDGDVLWYAANLARALKVKLSTVTAMNEDKLKKRYPAGFDEEKSKNRVEYKGPKTCNKNSALDQCECEDCN